MRIVASLGVQDEVDLIGRMITHLRTIGVDLIIACDIDSTDGTEEILEEYRSDEDFCLIRIRDRKSREARLAFFHTQAMSFVKQADADWVIFLDADEFPIPASGQLKDCVALEEADVLRIDLYNVPLDSGGAAMPDELVRDRYEQLLLIADPIRDFWKYLEENPGTPVIRRRVKPKVMARPALIESVTLAAHNIVELGVGRLPRVKPEDLVIAHVPFTTRDRFSRKVEKIRTTLTCHGELFQGRSGHHWRRLLGLAEKGLLDEEFDRMVFDAETIAELREQRVIRSAGELFRERMTVRSV